MRLGIWSVLCLVLRLKFSIQVPSGLTVAVLIICGAQDAADIFRGYK